jgi:flagellar protein FliS
VSRAALAYRASHAATASPGRLVVMLYDGVLRFLEEATRAYRAGDGPAGDRAVVRAERILLELMAALDLRYDLAPRLLEVYRFSFQQLADARRRRDVQTLERVRGWLAELRDAWAQAERHTRMGGVVS